MLTFGYDKYVHNRPAFNVIKEDDIDEISHISVFTNYFNIQSKKIGEIEEKYFIPIFIKNHKYWIDPKYKNPHFNEQAVIDIKNGKAKLIILFCFEWIWGGNYGFPSVIKLINDWILKYKLPYNSIVLSSGNYSSKQMSKNHRYIKYIPFSVWEHVYYMFINTKYHSHTEPVHVYKNLFKNSIIQKKKREKVYLSYNRTIRTQRGILVYKLKENELLKYGFVSLGTIMYCNKCFSGVPQDFLDTLPLTFDNTNLEENQAFDLSQQDYLESYISLVTETTIEKDEFFISEKICKPLFAMHPFIVLTSPGFLGFLKSLGYKTFSNWIDESYDLEDDMFKRIDLIIVEIKKLIEMSENELQEMLIEMLPILEHNHNHYIKRATSIEFQKQLEEELWK